MKKVLTIGGATQDIFIQYKPHESVQSKSNTPGQCFLMIEEGQKIEVSDLLYHSGGGATNAAVSFQKLGFDTTAFFKIADDAAGNFILQELKNFNIKTVPALSSEGQTGIGFIIPCPSGERIIFVHRGVNMNLHEEELPYDEIRAADITYVTSLSGPASDLLLPIAQYAKEHHKTVATNPGTPQIKDNPLALKAALKYVDILIMNATEAQLCAQSFAFSRVKNSNPSGAIGVPYLLEESAPFDLQNFFKEMLAAGPHTIVVTNGADGVYAAHKNIIYYHPSVPAQIVSTLGAGDAFGSCFVGSLENGLSIENAIRAGVINSSSVIQYIGAKAGLLDKQILEQMIANLDQDLLEVYKTP